MNQSGQAVEVSLDKRGWVSPLSVYNYKNLLVIVLILLLSVPSLCARGSLKWAWNAPDEKIQYFRYQLGGEDEEKWTVVDSSITSVVLSKSVLNTLYVQASYDGINWSVSGSATHIEEKSERDFALRGSITPYSLAFYRFYNGYNTSSTRTKTNSVYGFASSVEFIMPLSSWLSIYPELSYDIIVKKDTVIPGSRNVQYIKAGAGADFTFAVTEKSTVYIGLFGGAMIHINNKKASLTSYFGARVGYDYAIGEHFSFGAVSRVSFALFSGRSEALMNSMTILFDPLSITLAYRF